MIDQYGNNINETLHQFLNITPIKFRLLTDTTLLSWKLPEVKSPNIFAQNTSQFHPEGLFSEEIFGDVTDQLRFSLSAMIKLNTYIIHPVIFSTIVAPRSLYMNILLGKRYGIFNEEIQDFELVNQDDENASTGYNFFITHLDKIKNRTNTSNSLRANNKLELLNKYKELTISHLLCIPAGLRDIDLSSSRLASDDINKLYMGCLSLASGLSSYTLSTDEVFDGIRYQMQLKVNMIYEYIFNILDGKKGFIRRHYGMRKIALSARNVISAASNTYNSADDPAAIKSDEVMISLYMSIMCYQPFFVYFLKNNLFAEVFQFKNSQRAYVTDPKTLDTTIIDLSPSEINKYSTSRSMQKILSQFKYQRFRESPIGIELGDKSYYILLVYKVDKYVFIAKNKTEIKELVEQYNYAFELDNVKPLVWAEFLYIASTFITKDKYSTNTRYPVLQTESICPLKVHVVTTIKDNKKEVVFYGNVSFNLIHYPDLSSPFYESTIMHSSRLPGYGADFDGDQMSFIGVWSDESNRDMAKYLNQPLAILKPNLEFRLSTGTDIFKATLFNLTRQDIFVD